VQVVDRLFSIVKPDSAFFGQKDFQQLFIVRHMMTKLGHRTNVIGSPTIREVSGLAMSSRNTLLSVKARSNSSIIFRVLKQVQIEYINGLEIDQIITSGSNIINHTEGFELEYLEIVDPTRLTDIQKNENKSAIACIAAHVEGVRLIDNLTLIA
jgi:pantoate--beta-alanine ligase